MNKVFEKQIIKLTDFWYAYVSLDHHKDRDCHWYINKTYSYGAPPLYCVEHYGYIFDEDIDKKFPTYEKAEKYLVAVLKKAITKEKEWAEEVLKDPMDWDGSQLKKAKFIVNSDILNKGEGDK